MAQNPELPSNDVNSSPDNLSHPVQQPDFGLLGVVLLAQFHGVPADMAQLQHQFGQGKQAFGETELLLAIKSLDLKARIIKQPISRMGTASLPALVLKENGEHFILARVDTQQVLIHDLKQGRPVTLTQEEFAVLYEGRLLTIASRASAASALSKFDFTCLFRP